MHIAQCVRKWEKVQNAVQDPSERVAVPPAPERLLLHSYLPTGESKGPRCPKQRNQAAFSFAHHVIDVLVCSPRLCLILLPRLVDANAVEAFNQDMRLHREKFAMRHCDKCSKSISLLLWSRHRMVSPDLF